MSGDSDVGPWWRRGFFDTTYADFGLAGADPEHVRRVVDFITDRLALRPGDRLFDQCCGIGRLSLVLARRGIHVIGVEQTPEYVERARAGALAETLLAEFHCGDAFEFETAEPCDAAINWFTSFGYAEDDDVNVRMLERAFASLRPGGRFALDFQNIPRVMGDFRSRNFDPPEPGDGLIVLQESRPDFVRGMIDSTWTFVHPDGRRDRRVVATRLFMPHELVGLVRRSGFCDVELCGSLDGDPFDLRSPRCIVFARRPG